MGFMGFIKLTRFWFRDFFFWEVWVWSTSFAFGVFSDLRFGGY